MKIEILEKELNDFKKHFKKGGNLKNYCNAKNISYTFTCRLLNKDFYEMELLSAYKFLGLTPERNLSQVVLNTKIKNLKLIKEALEAKLI